MPLRPEAEHRRRRAERLREVRQRRDPDAAADEERPLDVEPEAVAERAEDVDRVAGLERGERLRPGPDRVEQERELAAGARQRLIGRGSSRPGASSMKNCPGMPGSSPPRSSLRSVYGPDGLVAR